MTPKITGEFIETLRVLLKNECFQLLLEHMKERQETITINVMNSQECNPFNRGKACGIEWCRSLPTALIEQYITDQDTSDT